VGVPWRKNRSRFLIEFGKAGELEHEANRQWKRALWLLVPLAAAIAVLSWERLHNHPYSLSAVPAGLLLARFGPRTAAPARPDTATIAARF
jgi:hypothetical protein